MSEKSFFVVRAMYLGSEPMGELLEGENGSDAIQVPLKRTILRTENAGEEVELTLTPDSMLVLFADSNRNSNKNKIILPIDLLAYCGALRQLPPYKIKEREFETLDKSPSLNVNDPPLFVTIFRDFEQENTLFCHSFIIRKDDEAMELVKLVMEIYYNLIRLQEFHENSFQANELLEKKSNSSIGQNESNMLSKSQSFNEFETKKNSIPQYQKAKSDQEYKELLDIYNKVALQENKESEEKYKNGDQIDVVSAKNILAKSMNDLNIKNDDESKDDYQISDDSNQIVIRKKNDESIVYKQNVFIRWLQPPTPPPLAPIIIREVQEESPEQAPLVIYKQAPRPETPPPLVIRERPPSPLIQFNKPLIIEKKVPSQQESQRKVIIEHLPAPPAKPRDIILEKWLPRNFPSERTVYYQKLNNRNSNNQYLCRYNSVESLKKNLQSPINRNIKNIKEIKHFSKNDSKYVSHANYSAEDLMEIGSCSKSQELDFYKPQNSIKKNSKVAGYRIIRQIIPGPNSSSTDIQKALARSQYVTTSLSNNQQICSPIFDAHNSNNNNQIYSGSNLNLPDTYAINSGSIYNLPASYRKKKIPFQNYSTQSLYMQPQTNYQSHIIYDKKVELNSN